jgi:hypothetical protein
MARDRKDLGARKFVRVDLQKPGFLIPAPDAPWIECYILDISENGACLDVGDLAVPKMFGLSLTAGGEVASASSPRGNCGRGRHRQASRTRLPTRRTPKASQRNFPPIPCSVSDTRRGRSQAMPQSGSFPLGFF